MSKDKDTKKVEVCCIFVILPFFKGEKYDLA
jgi:hypothetical protein